MENKKLSRPFKEEAVVFLDTVKAGRLNRNLRFMLLAYLNESRHELPWYHEDLLYDIEWLFSFLDAAQKEQKKIRKKEKMQVEMQAA